MGIHYPTWEDLYLQFHQRLNRRARRMTHGNIDKAEDLVQDTLVHVLASPIRPSELRTPLAFFFRVMRNVFIDQVRKAKGKQVITLDDPRNIELQKQLPMVESSIQRDLENKELLEAIRLKSPRLSRHERRLLELMADGKDPEEISDILNEDIRITRADCNALKAKLRYRMIRSTLGRTRKLN